jgi:coatomer protein complex subunit alpha (xenin)
LLKCDLSCREYNVALRIELKRKEMKDDPKRTAELAAYFTHAKLQPVHQARARTPYISC